MIFFLCGWVDFIALYCGCPPVIRKPQILLFLCLCLCYLSTYSRIYSIQEKYWVWWERLQAVLGSTGNRIFFKGSAQSWSCAIPCDCQTTGKIHTHMHVGWLCENVTSQHQQNIRRKDQSEKTSDTSVQVMLPLLCINLPFFPSLPFALRMSQFFCWGTIMDISK